MKSILVVVPARFDTATDEPIKQAFNQNEKIATVIDWLVNTVGFTNRDKLIVYWGEIALEPNRPLASYHMPDMVSITVVENSGGV